MSETAEKIARLIVGAVLLIPAVTLLVLVWIFALVRWDAAARVIGNALYDVTGLGMRIVKKEEE